MELKREFEDLLAAEDLPFAAVMWEQERLYSIDGVGQFAIDWDIITRDWLE